MGPCLSNSTLAKSSRNNNEKSNNSNDNNNKIPPRPPPPLPPLVPIQINKDITSIAKRRHHQVHDRASGLLVFFAPSHVYDRYRLYCTFLLRPKEVNAA